MKGVMKIFKNRLFIAMVCILLAGGISFGLLPFANSRTREVTTVVRVKREVPKNTLITTDMLTVVEVGKFGLPNDVIQDAKDIAGKYSAVDLLPSDNLIPSKLRSDEELPDNRLYDLPQDGKLAVSITVKSLAAGFSGKLQAGDVVAVAAAMREQSGVSGSVVFYPELAYMEVAAVTNAKAQNTDEKSGQSELNKDVLPATVTLIVNSDQAKRLIEIENSGSVHLVFVGRGVEARKLLAEFVPPTPQPQEERDLSMQSDWGEEN